MTTPPTSRHMTQHQRRLVVGGHNVVQGRYPYFVSIDKNNGVVLNGALIAPDIVLSAGHIVLDHMDNLTMTVNAWSVHAVNSTLQEVIPVERWVLHPKWSQFSPGYFAHDAIILKLNGTSSYAPIKINRDSTVPANGDEVRILGLGWTQELVQSPSDIVQEADLLVVSNEECEAAKDLNRSLSYEGLIVPTMMCTRSPPNTTRDGCAWDSGAPLIRAGDTPNEDLLVALGSTGIGCADPIFPAIQERVSADMDWIGWMVCQLSTDPPEDFHCENVTRGANWTANATVPTSIPVSASALAEANMVAPPLFGREEGPFWLPKESFLVVCVLFVLMGAIGMQLGVRRAARRAYYTPL